MAHRSNGHIAAKAKRTKRPSIGAAVAAADTNAKGKKGKLQSRWRQPKRNNNQERRPRGRLQYTNDSSADEQRCIICKKKEKNLEEDPRY